MKPAWLRAVRCFNRRPGIVALAGTSVAWAALAIGAACTPAEVAAFAPLAAAAEQGLVALVQAEAQRANVPPTDPAYLTALAAAKALEAESADAGAQIQHRLDAIVGEMRKQRRACPSASAVFPSAPAIRLAVAVADAGSD